MWPARQVVLPELLRLIPACEDAAGQVQARVMEDAGILILFHEIRVRRHLAQDVVKRRTVLRIRSLHNFPSERVSTEKCL